MPKLVQCNYCHKTAPLSEPMNFMPEGWLSVTERHDTKPDRFAELCGLPCLSVWAHDRSMESAEPSL